MVTCCARCILPLKKSENHDEGEIYNNEIVGECCECSGMGIITETYPETMCVGCGGTGIIYYGKENIN